MGISVEDAVKELQARETVFVAYSQATKLPYVTCGEETYNDQVWFFAEEETLKEYGKKKLEDKILLMGMRYEKKDFPRMYGLLFSIGVNSVIWNNGADEIEIDLEKIVRKPDLSQMEPAKRPLINPTLQLSGIYFMQELRRPVEKEEHKKMIVEAISLLTDKERSVVTLYYYEEMTLKEISLVLDVSESRVSQLHTKALLKMKSKLGPYLNILI